MANINFDKVEKLVETGYIVKRKHPDKELYIYNYTNKTQFDGLWNEETMVCRGLIVDEFNHIISRPFKKFFNIEQLQYKTPDCNYDIYKKLDGSLGISYPVNGSYGIATRGSFESPQAIKATKMLRKYDYTFEGGKTYLFEIIYPDNRVVIDYKEKEELVLIGIINNKTGEDELLKNIGFEIVHKEENETVEKLMKIQRDNEEGFVLKFDNGERIKIKMEEYKRLHKLLTGVSKKNIWENLKEGSVSQLLENVPDEFNEWCKKTISEIETEYKKIETVCKNEFRELGDRKETAIYYKTCSYPGILFSMLDERDYSEAIWKLVKPSNSDVYRQGRQ